MTSKTDNRLILLNESDNIFVCRRKMEAGETVLIEGSDVSLETGIELGHKLARVDIRRGEKIIKYGVSIGSAKTDISRGDHVHLHNIKSDYIPSHLRDGKVVDINIPKENKS